MIRTDTVTLPLIVHSLPPRNPYGEVIGRWDKGCESGIGGEPDFLYAGVKYLFIVFVQFLGGVAGWNRLKHTQNTVKRCYATEIPVLGCATFNPLVLVISLGISFSN